MCVPDFNLCPHHLDSQFWDGELSNGRELVVGDTIQLNKLPLQLTNDNLYNTHTHTHMHIRTYKVIIM